MFGFLSDMIGLQKPGPRLVMVLLLHCLLLIVTYKALEGAGLSLFGRLDIPSPSIGLTRAYWLLLHGNINAAYAMNPLIFIVAPVIWALIFKDIYTLAHYRKTLKLPKDMIQ